MTTITVARSEWVKMRSLRSSIGSLIGIFLLTVGFGALVCSLIKESEFGLPDFDPLELSFYGLTFGQIAAISFGTLALSQEFHQSALRVSLAAVPRRGLFYVSKMAVIGGAVLVVGLLAGLTTFLLGQALIGDAGIGISDTGALRAVLGSGIYLALIALFAAGLTALLRSAVAVLSVLIPLLLLVPFIFTDFASGVMSYLPNRAGQTVIRQYPNGLIGPWAGLGVTALWTGAALLAGWVAIKRRDA
ncbi:MAG: ABC transporter permease [Nakamurella sp.]